jgi:flagellar hook-associated protein FlgK
MRFKHFLLNENKAFFATKMGDLLTALQELEQNAAHIGARQQVANAEQIVNYIRKILHDNWSKEEEQYLATLQKVGVAIMRCIDEADDMPSIIASCTREIEKLMGDIGTPINNLAVPDQTEPDSNQKETPDAH